MQNQVVDQPPALTPKVPHLGLSRGFPVSTRSWSRGDVSLALSLYSFGVASDRLSLYFFRNRILLEHNRAPPAMDTGLGERFSSAHVINPARGFDASKLRGKTVIITGGASGIGEASLRAFVEAGAFVVFSDISAERGNAIATELGHDKVAFVRGDVTDWADQKRLFKTAVEESPSGYINIVFANAAIVKGVDSVFEDAVEEDGELVEPDFSVAEIGFRGVLLTTKLAVHYFRRQLPKEGKDHCLIITASVAGYWDHPGQPQYAMIKWGARGLFRAVGSSMPENEIRVNLLAPWSV